MKKIKTIIILSITLYTSYITSVKLPTSEVLTQRFKEHGLDYIIENTTIITQLADKEIAPMMIAITINLELISQPSFNHSEGNALLLEHLNQKVLALILSDYPKELDNLHKVFKEIDSP